MAIEPGNSARNKLIALEKRRTLAIISEFQKIQVRLMSEISDLLERIDRERAIDGNASPGTLFRKAQLDKLLNEVTGEIKLSSRKLAAIVSGGQVEAVDIAKAEAEKIPQLAAEIGGFDPAAAKVVIGLAGDGKPLAVYFADLATPIRSAMFDALFYGVATGTPNAQIAREVRDAIGGGTARAMTIARTETNRAYRESSRQFYETTPGVIGWRWLSALDLRTCPICWALHGRIFKTKTKFGTHPNCRCTMVPVFAGDAPAKTGPDVFDGLTEAQQKAILGPKRFELYQQGAKLSDFVETNKSVFGIGRNIKPLIRTTFKPRVLPPVTPPTPTPAPKPTPAVIIPPIVAPIPKFDAKAIREQFVVDANAHRPARFDEALAKAESEYKAASNSYWVLPSIDRTTAAFEAVERTKGIRDRLIEKRAEFLVTDRDLLKVANPVKLTVNLARPDSAMKTKPERRARIMETLAEYQNLVDAKAWPGRKDLSIVHKPNARGVYYHGPRYLVTDADRDTKRRLTVHEISHSLEMSNPDNLAAGRAFLNYRTKGEAFVKLSKLYPGYGYKNWEVARPDKFKSAYVGKHYDDATEVISMGVEYLYADPLQFALDDPEYFEFILHVIRGEKWLLPK